MTKSIKYAFTKEQLIDRLRQTGKAYKQLLVGSEALLELNSLYWTEKLLLKLVRMVYQIRLNQLAAVMPLPVATNDNPAQIKETMLESAVEAALGCHELGEWEQVEDGWQARCQLCQVTTWVGDNGLKYSLLEDTCPGASTDSGNH